MREDIADSGQFGSIKTRLFEKRKVADGPKGGGSCGEGVEKGSEEPGNWQMVCEEQVERLKKTGE